VTLTLAALPSNDDPTSRNFAALMTPFAPFEARPHLAVAVSGGGDSMALLLLAQDWACARGGRVTALTVDHGLRPEAAAEAAQVASWCAAGGIDHVVLRRVGPAPRSGVQAAARAARYALLEAWCRAHFVLHLLLAHQREDQAETVKMRAARGSGVDGLAGMASIAERGAVRLLRPLLGIPRAHLRDFLAARGQGWIEDPSNRNPAFTRVQVRATLGAAAPGSSDAHLAATATRLGRDRAAHEGEDARRLARWLALHPAGFVWLDPRGFAGPEALGVKALGAVLAMVSGREFPPRRDGIERLQEEFTTGLGTNGFGKGRTLGGCLVLSQRGKILICREPAVVAAPVPVLPDGRTRWDGRFQLSLDPGASAPLWLGALGRDGVAIRRESRKTAIAAIPAAARPSLPALCDAKGVVAVPALGYFKCCSQEALMAARQLQFRPNRPLTGAGFTIV
jgi:tRNA(Ile)-lysidine synthase